jgi:hypothetical protein
MRLLAGLHTHTVVSEHIAGVRVLRARRDRSRLAIATHEGKTRP